LIHFIASLSIAQNYYKTTSDLLQISKKGRDNVARTKRVSSSESSRRSRPALTPEARENQLVALAVDLAEQQLRDGTASSQVITHYLKLGTARERLERERLEKENELLMAKTEAIQSAKRVEELYMNALNAMRNYSGNGGDEEDD
jgi:hypothetical protein